MAARFRTWRLASLAGRSFVTVAFGKVAFGKGH